MRIARIFILPFTFAALHWTVPTANAELVEALRPVPVELDQIAAIKRVREAFSELYKSRNPESKARLREKLIQAAEESKDDAVVHFVLLSEARDVSIELGEPALALASFSDEELGQIVSLVHSKHFFNRLIRQTSANSARFSTRFRPRADGAAETSRCETGQFLATIRYALPEKASFSDRA